MVKCCKKATQASGRLADPPRGGEAYGHNCIDTYYHIAVNYSHTKITAPGQDCGYFQNNNILVG